MSTHTDEHDFGLHTWEDMQVAGLDDQDIALLLNARNYTYYCSMIKQIKSNDCPFCKIDDRLNEILLVTGDWQVWECPEEFKAKNLERHFVLSPKKHITDLKEMGQRDWLDLTDLIKEITEKYKLVGGAVMMRFGDPRRNAQSIRHLHCNLYVPTGKGEVKLTIAKDKKKIEEKEKLVLAWEKMRRYGEKHPNLTPEQLANSLSGEERALVIDRLA